MLDWRCTLAPNGDVAVTGLFGRAVTFGSLSLTAAGNSFFAARYSAQANQWQQLSGAACPTVVPGNTFMAKAVLAANGDIIFAASTNQPVQFGTTAALNRAGQQYFFITRLGASSGQWQWAAQADIEFTSTPVRVVLALTRANDVVLAAPWGRPIVFGTLPPLTSAGGSVLMASLGGSSGQWQWADKTGGSTIVSPDALALASTDELVLAGSFTSRLRLGSLPLQTANSAGAFVARRGAMGGPWQHVTVAVPELLPTLPSSLPGSIGAAFVSLTAADEPVVGGSFNGFSTFGNSSFMLCGYTLLHGGTDLFVARIGAVPLAVTPPVLAEQVQVYPTPARHSFSLRLPAGPAPTKLVLLNSLGQVVRQQAVPAQTTALTVDVRGLAPGLYTLRLPMGVETVSRRVVLE